MVYPTPHTVLMNLGLLAGSPSFSRSRPMWAMTVLLFVRYFSPHTASKSSSEGTTVPCRSQRYHRMENSIGVSYSSFPNRRHLWLSLLMTRPRMSYSWDWKAAGLLYRRYRRSCVFTLATTSRGLKGFVM